RRMHRYIKSPTEENYAAFVELGEQRDPIAVRDLLEVAPADPIPLDEVESEASILSRFSTQAMSLGAVSPETHRTLAIAMNRLGVKLVASTGVGIIAAGVAKAGADVITISGHDGGTGASPLSSIKNTGLPWEAGLRDTHVALSKAGLRGRVRLRVDGGFKFARDVILAALLGADEFGFGTAALLALGCVMARQCHLNTCPVGIATQNERLRTRFTGTPEMVETYFRGLAREVRERLAGMGARSIEEIVGWVERLR